MSPDNSANGRDIDIIMLVEVGNNPSPVEMVRLTTVHVFGEHSHCLRSAILVPGMR
jgi:hypothetical protein